MASSVRLCLFNCFHRLGSLKHVKTLNFHCMVQLDTFTVKYLTQFQPHRGMPVLRHFTAAWFCGLQFLKNLDQDNANIVVATDGSLAI